MKLIIIALLMSVCSGAQLDNHYLPPSNAVHSGGDGSILGAPHLRDRFQGLGPDSAPRTQYGTPSQQQYTPQLISNQEKAQTTLSRLYGSPQQNTQPGHQQSGFSDSGIPSGNQAFSSRFGSPDQASTYPQDRFSTEKAQQKSPSQLYGSPVQSGQAQNEYTNGRTTPGQQSLSARFGSPADASSGQPQSSPGSRLSQKAPSQIYGSPAGSVSGQTLDQYSRAGTFGQQTPSQLYGTPETQSRFAQQEKPVTSAVPQQSAFNVPSDSQQQFAGPQAKQRFGQTPQTGAPKHSTPFGTSDVHGPSDTTDSRFGVDSRSNQFKTTTGQNIPQYSNQGQAYPNLQQKNYQTSKSLERPDDGESHIESRFGPSRTPNAYNPEQNAVILRQNSEVNFDGTYAFDFETSDGTAREENGHPDYTESEEGDEVVSGSYRYTAPSGEIFTVEYIADKDGFRPTGDHLPTSPPIPEAILRSLEQNAAEEALDGRARDNFSPETQKYTPGQYPTSEQDVKLGSRFGQNQQFESGQARTSPSSGAYHQQSSFAKTNLPGQQYTSGAPSYEQRTTQYQQPGQPKIQSQGFGSPSQQSVQTPSSRFGNQQPGSSLSTSDQLTGYPSGRAKNVGIFGSESEDVSGKQPAQKYPSSPQSYPSPAQPSLSARFGDQQEKPTKYSPDSPLSSQGQDYPSVSGRPFDSQGLKPRFGIQQTGKTSYPSDDEFSGYPSGPAKSNIKPVGVNAQQYPSGGQSYPSSGPRDQYSQDKDNYQEAARPGQLTSRFGGQKPLTKPNRLAGQSSGIVSPDLTSTSFGPGLSGQQGQEIEPRGQQRPNVFGTMQSKQGTKFGEPTNGFKGYPSSEDSDRYSSAPSQGFRGPSTGATKLQDRFGGSKTTPQQAFDPESGYVY